MSNMVVNTNVLALNSHRALKNVGQRQGVASARLSSGLRINSAADDAAGLAISEKMRAQIRGLDMASRNTQDAISLIQTAEGGMQEVNNMLQRIRELVDFAANDTNEESFDGTGDRQKVQDEIDQLIQEIDSIAGRVEFNTKRLIDGSFADTRGQRAQAQIIADQTSLQLSGAAARAQALNAQLVTDRVALDSRQEILDAAQIEHAVNIRTYTESSEAYNRARREYLAAVEALQNAIVDTELGIVNLQDLASFLARPGSGPNGGGGVERIDEASVKALQIALMEYARAASVYGSNTMGLGAFATTGIANGATAVQLQSLFAPGANGAQGAREIWLSNVGTTFTETINAAHTHPSLETLTGMRASHSTAAATFLTQTTNFEATVAARDQAMNNFVGTQRLVSEAVADIRTANTVNNATQRSLNAAIEADNAGGTRALFFQVGANANQSLITSIGSVRSDILGIGDGRGESRINVVRASGSQITSYLSVMDRALSYVTTERSKLGAAQNRLEFTMRSLDISSENLSAAESRIRDADMAREMMSVTQSNVLQQAAISMLAQANQAPQSVLQLL